jgi:hypothetical protein
MTLRLLSAEPGRAATPPSGSLPQRKENTMKKLPGFIPLAALIMTGAIQMATAQQTQTDEVLVLNFQLTTVAQGPTTTGRNTIVSEVQVGKVTSQDVIQALGAAEGVAFSSKARLVLLTPTNDLENWSFRVKDGGNEVDVTGFFSHQHVSGLVASTLVNTKTGDFADVDYSIDSFNLVDQPGFPALGLHLNLSGFTVLSTRGLVNRRGTVTGQLDRLEERVSGTGDQNGNGIIVHGSISAESTGTEVVTTSGGGNS